MNVWHGSRVEISEHGFCEVVWDGPFDAFDFDHSDIIFGSDCRQRGDALTFVSAGSTVDRLQLLRTPGGASLSNSLACLAGHLQLNFDVTYSHYYRDFCSIEGGLNKAEKTIRSDRGPVELVYFHNISWNGRQLAIVTKPDGERTFAQFSDFEDFLRDSIAVLGDNMSAEGRSFPFQPQGTLSTGYDSTTVAVLTRDIGCTQVVSFLEARGGQNDYGSEIAEKLGLEIIPVSREAWRELPLAEVPFRAANTYGE